MADVTVPTAKVKGPIRHGAVVPTLILALICFLLFKFALDFGIKRGVEWAVSHAVGAEADVGSVHTSFLRGSFTLNKLQITNKTEPSQNVLQIGQIRFALSWGALLRLKFVITDAGIDGIALYTPRTGSGWVAPPPKPADPNAPGTLDSIQDSITKQVQGSGPQDPLGGLAKLLAGTSQEDLIKNAQATLKSEAQIKALQAEVQTKQKEWKDKIAKLPQQKDFDEIIKEAKTLKFDLNKPQEFANNLKKAKELKDRADVKLKEIKSTTDGIKANVDHMNNEYKGLDKLVQDDIKSVQSGLNISDLNVKDLSRAIFANYLAQKLGAYAKYMALAEQYMGNSKKNKAAQKNELIPPKRGSGINYRYPITTRYPLFWLQRATISSKATDEGFSGNLNGTLTNVTTEPAVVGQPAILDVKGDFPKQNINDTGLKIVLNHVQDPAEDSLVLKVGSYPVQNFSLTNSGDLKLAIQEAKGASVVAAIYRQSNLNFTLNNEYSNVKYNVDAGGAFKDALTSVLNGIPKITVKAGAQGPLNNLSFNVDSNLGEELANGLKKYLQGKIDLVQKQIKDEIDSRINVPKQQLAGQLQQANGAAGSEIKSENQTASSASQQVTNQTKGGSGSGSLQDKLLNGLHF